MIAAQKTNAPEALDLAEEAPDAQEDPMVDGLSVAGKNPSNLSVDALVQRRSALCEALDAVDVELGRRGLRPTRRATGAPRSVSLLITAALSDGDLDVRSIAAKTGQGIHACHQLVHKLTVAGELRRVARGRYALATRTR